ncbi:hypothetical protein QNI19_05630 [Cytophagaceae bacterium DM2B3-1]|uniref:DUF1048 domain-containing protein n=1 Tax=Xanthocytophaga flava TaxID=3048013 RepID=A0ABT7CFB3_9BACT|nr:hypothetical protein [Xanthocytophaga flavus]MDJ1492400.1 hypothetical protein [Xanthocytophaga flavus]
MPVVKVKELPAYYHLLDAIWQKKFHVSLREDKNIIENRKQFRQYIANNYGLYTGEFDSKRFEDIFNGIRNTEYFPDAIAESSLPISNYPGIELLEAYCCEYYQMPVGGLSEFKEGAKSGRTWHKFLSDYYTIHPSATKHSELTPKEFVLFGINFCSIRQVLLLALSTLSLVFVIGVVLYFCIQGGYLSFLSPPDQIIETHQKGYYLSLSIASLIQSLIILVLIMIYYYDEDLGGKKYVDNLASSIIKTTLEQFQSGWIGIWISLFFLYLWFALKWSIESGMLGDIEIAQLQGNAAVLDNLKNHYLQFKGISWIVADLLNLIGPVLYFYLYFILDTESIATEQHPSRNQFFLSVMKVILIVSVLLFILSLCDRLVYLGDFQNLPTLIYSLFTSIAMSMFFGKLSSHFFNTSPSARVFFIPLFYLYAALQAVYGMLGFKNVHISVSLITMVFVLKIILFFYISKLITKRKVDMYLTKILDRE